jgi:ABC-type transporter Mla MlaB component
MAQNAPATPYRLKLAGRLTFDQCETIESTIADALRHCERLEADLADISEIDLYGVHLLARLQDAGTIVAISQDIEEASRRLLSPCRGGSLGRLARQSLSGC